MTAEEIAREIARTCWPSVALIQTVTEALRAAEARGYERAREQAAGIAENQRRQWVNGEAATSYGKAYQKACDDTAASLRAMQPETNP